MKTQQSAASSDDLKAALVSALLLHAQHGEEAAFKSLYELHKTRVYATCRRLSATRQAAEAAAAQVFLKAFSEVGAVKDGYELVRRMDNLAIRFASGRLAETRRTSRSGLARLWSPRLKNTEQEEA